MSQQPPPTGSYAPQRPSNGIAVAALVCGIIAAVFGFIPGLNIFIATILGILAIIFGAVGIKKANELGGERKGMAIAGLILGAVGLIITIIFTVVIVNVGQDINAELQEQLEQDLQDLATE